jgi:hypothetical protein
VPEGHVDFAQQSARLKPSPFKTTPTYEFSAAGEGRAILLNFRHGSSRAQLQSTSETGFSEACEVVP